MKYVVNHFVDGESTLEIMDMQQIGYLCNLNHRKVPIGMKVWALMNGMMVKLNIGIKTDNGIDILTLRHGSDTVNSIYMNYLPRI